MYVYDLMHCKSKKKTDEQEVTSLIAVQDHGLQRTRAAKTHQPVVFTHWILVIDRPDGVNITQQPVLAWSCLHRSSHIHIPTCTQHVLHWGHQVSGYSMFLV